MAKLYSSERLLAFIILLLAYCVIFGLLWGADPDVIDFSSVTGLEKMLISIPFVALYVVILIGVTAGYARAAFAAKALGLMRAVRQQLRTMSIEDVSIKSKIRSDSVVTMDTPFLRTLEKVITARLPILPVKEGEKVFRVITIRDILQELTHQINMVREESQTEELFTRLNRLKVKNLNPRLLMACKEDDNLDSVIEKMMRNQFTRLAVMDKDGTACIGTIDLFDVMSEILSEHTAPN